MELSERMVSRDHISHKRIKTKVNKYINLYLMSFPALLWLMIFCYVPMIGLVMAFQDYNPLDGIWGSRWVGLDNFKDFVTGFYFTRLIRNTIFINALKIAVCFPAPIILSIMINELNIKWFKRITQSFSYLPYFISWIVVAGFMESILSPSTGIVNKFIIQVGGKSIYFLSEKSWFYPLVLLSSLWKYIGWDAIIYLAAIAGVNLELYEAARIDGCSRFKQAWHITLPSIRPLIILLFVLSISNILNADFTQLIALVGNNYALYEVGDVIDTFVYRNGVLNSSYGFTTAIGLFKGIISLVLILSANKFIKLLGEDGIF